MKEIATKQLALDLLEQTRPDYVRYAREVAERVCRERGSVTVDDIRDIAGVPSGKDARVLGAILRPPRFRLLGYERGTRSESHKRAVGRFVLA